MSKDDYINQPRLEAVASKKAKHIRYGDILSSSQLEILSEASRLANHMGAGVASFGTNSKTAGNSHIFVTEINRSSEKDFERIEKFGDYVEISYATRSGTGSFRIGVDVEVLTYSNEY
mgnify:CR=1 FL=1